MSNGAKNEVSVDRFEDLPDNKLSVAINLFKFTRLPSSDGSTSPKKFFESVMP